MVSFVYFDLGGVAELDFSGTNKWAKFKNEVGIGPEKDKEFECFWRKYEAEVCVGLDIETLIPLMKEKFDIQFPHSYSLLLNGFVNHFEVNKTIWLAIEKIRKRCRIGLLTNAYPGMYDAIKSRGLLPPVVWNIIIDSSVVGLKKPDPKIFQLAEGKAEAKGPEILFVENSPGHIKAAQVFGWQTFLYDPVHPRDSSRKLLELCSTLFD